MALNPDQITASNFKEFYDRLYPYLGVKAAGGFTPVGTIITVIGLTAPVNYLECNGQTVLLDVYPELANYFTEQFGAVDYFGGDGVTTFGLPDLNSSDVVDAVFAIAVKNIISFPASFAGVPTGGTAGQVLTKQSSADGDCAWQPLFVYDSNVRKVVGTWIDGKPIYQRTIVATNISIPNNSTPLNVELMGDEGNIENIVNCFGAFRSSNDSVEQPFLPYAANNFSLNFRIGQYRSMMLTAYNTSGSAITIARLIATFQYTKTSD